MATGMWHSRWSEGSSCVVLDCCCTAPRSRFWGHCKLILAVRLRRTLFVMHASYISIEKSLQTALFNMLSIKSFLAACAILSTSTAFAQDLTTQTLQGGVYASQGMLAEAETVSTKLAPGCVQVTLCVVHDPNNIYICIYTLANLLTALPADPAFAGVQQDFITNATAGKVYA